jgi:hypothetical protein
MKTDFDIAKQRVIHLADVLKKANTPQELRALLLADTQAPYHSYDMLELLSAVENIGCNLASVLSECIGEHGEPL